MFYKVQFIFYRDKTGSAPDLLSELMSFVNKIPDWQEKPKEWIIAHPSEFMLAFKDGNINDEAVKYVETIIQKDDIFNIVLADKNRDDSILTISLMNTPVVSSMRYYLTLTIKKLSKMNDKLVFIKFLEKILDVHEWSVKFILLDTEQYKRNRKSVFNDRLAVGWMLYLPTKIERNHALSASDVINFTNSLGTLIISKDKFDGSDVNDIYIANNIEIELSAHGELPKISEI